MISNNVDHIFQVTKGIGYSSLPKIDEKISSFILQEIEKQLKKNF